MNLLIDWNQLPPNPYYILLSTLLFKVYNQATQFLPLSSPLNNSQTLFIPVICIHFEHFLLSIPTPSYFTVFISPFAIMFQLNFILALSLLHQSPCLLPSQHPVANNSAACSLYTSRHSIWFSIPVSTIYSAISSILLSAVATSITENHPQSTRTLPYNPAILLPLLAQS